MLVLLWSAMLEVTTIQASSSDCHKLVPHKGQILTGSCSLHHQAAQRLSFLRPTFIPQVAGVNTKQGLQIRQG